MNEQRFRSEMRRAQAMGRAGNCYEADYWNGFQRGLRKAYHGEKFGTPEEHALWLSLVDRDDETSKQRGRGYRDGLVCDEVVGRRGRPPITGEETETVGVRLPLSTIEQIPKPRSEWIRDTVTEKLRLGYCTQNDGNYCAK